MKSGSYCASFLADNNPFNWISQNVDSKSKTRSIETLKDGQMQHLHEIKMTESQEVECSTQ